MSRFKDPETGNLERSVYDRTPQLDSEDREVAMRTSFIKAGRYLVKRGDNLNGLLKEIFK